MWLLESVDPDRLVMVFGPDCEMDISEAHLTGLPMGGRPVKEEQELVQEKALELVVKSVTDSCIIKPLTIPEVRKKFTSIATHPIDHELYGQLVHCFALLCIGYFMAPQPRSEELLHSVYSAISDPAKMAEYNWCGFIREHLALAAIDIKEAKRHNRSRLWLAGCHLVLQVISSLLFSIVNLGCCYSITYIT